jgi:hypothetical protein
MNRRTGQFVFAFGVGLLVAILAYRWIADTGPRAERALQESVVAESRLLLNATLNIGQLELVDPLSPSRKVGKSYVYRADAGWEVSGYYRRSEQDLWHPYLVSMDASMSLTHLKISDTALLGRTGDGPLEVLP